jgi:hypothetical protein
MSSICPLHTAIALKQHWLGLSFKVIDLCLQRSKVSDKVGIGIWLLQIVPNKFAITLHDLFPAMYDVSGAFGGLPLLSMQGAPHSTLGHLFSAPISTTLSQRNSCERQIIEHTSNDQTGSAYFGISDCRINALSNKIRADHKIGE